MSFAVDQHGNKRRPGDTLRLGERLFVRMIVDAAPPTFTDSYGRVLSAGNNGDNGQGAYEARLRDAWRNV